MRYHSEVVNLSLEVTIQLLVHHRVLLRVYNDSMLLILVESKKKKYLKL